MISKHPEVRSRKIEEFKASLSYNNVFESSLGYMKICLKRKKKTKKGFL